MATIAEFALPPEAFPLGVVFEAFPDAAIQLERVVPIGEAVRPYFWIENVASRSICEFFDRDSAIEDATLIDPLGNRSLFRYRSRLGENGVLSALFGRGTDADVGVTFRYAGYTVAVGDGMLSVRPAE